MQPATGTMPSSDPIYAAAEERFCDGVKQHLETRAMLNSPFPLFQASMRRVVRDCLDALLAASLAAVLDRGLAGVTEDFNEVMRQRYRETGQEERAKRLERHDPLFSRVGSLPHFEYLLANQT